MDIKNILTTYKIVAVVGCSKNITKPGHKVPKYLKEHGYRIIPINPTADRILGVKCYPRLMEIPDKTAQKVDIVDIFRPSEDVGLIVDDAIKLRKRFGKPDVIWMQLGIINKEAARMAKHAGFKVVMDHCMKREHKKLATQN